MFKDLFPEMDLHAKIQNFLSELFRNSFMAEKMFARINPLAEYRMHFGRATGTAEKVLNFSFTRIYGTDQEGKRTKHIDKVMVVIDDRTHEYELAQELENKAKEQAQKVEKLYQILRLDPQVFTNFINEAVESLDGMRTRLADLGTDTAENKHIIAECFRTVHTLKGNARAMNLDSVSERAHGLEDVLALVREHPEKLDDETREKVIKGMRLLHEEIQDGNALFSKILNMKDALSATAKDPFKEFQESVHSIVEKESKYAEKNVRLQLTNNVTKKLSANVVRRIRGPVIQLLRNAIDHGLEDASGRLAAGKPEVGTIQLTLHEEEEHLFIVCEDDGKGLDVELIRTKAVEKNILSAAQAEAMPSRDIYRLIFQSGFSTSAKVTELSGRGVGMDVIRVDIKELGGKIYLSTQPGHHTRFALKIPLDETKLAGKGAGK